MGHLEVASVVDRRQDLSYIRQWMEEEKEYGWHRRLQRDGAVRESLMRLLRDTSDQLVQSRQQKL
jgi:hypothetical protein